jgi:hypothetical protein
MENIALAFSGGGFRAACFSLGSLSYLDRIQYKGQSLLKNVRFISSTSGGSITNLVYSSHLFKGKTFEECYQFLLKELEGEKLIAKALQILNSSEEWKKRPAKGRNLINAFSIAYDELFAKATFELFSIRDSNPHLEEICVNSTEFTNGLPFRFQSQHPHEDFPKGRVGNNYIFFDRQGLQAAARLKLGDILASSSCFPSGFEPMIFPGDYSYDQLTETDLREGISFRANSFTLSKPEKSSQEKFENIDLLADSQFINDLHFGIMDGGVTDNQAIDAFKRADDRRKNNDLPEFDLFMVCDVTSFFMDGYTLPLEKKKWYNRISLLAIIIIWVLSILIFPALLIAGGRPWTGWMYVVSTISALLALPFVYFLYRAINKLIVRKKKASTWGKMFNKYLPVFLKLRIGALKQMMAARFKSVFILANDIYLKQIRRMYFDELFRDESYKNRVIQNTIYDLSKAKFDTAESHDNDKLHPSERMIAIAEKARTMGTTLWFDSRHVSEQMKECIIATGQFTTCFNLLRYLSKKEAGTLTQELEQLKADLEADWVKFLLNPMYMFSQAE